MALLERSHEVTNQPPPLVPYNAFEADVALREALQREGGGFGAERLRDIGELAGSEAAAVHAERCERNEPLLRTHDRYGHRIDRVDLDPSWHWLLRQAIEREVHSLPWRERRPGAHVARAALFFVWSQGRSRYLPEASRFDFSGDYRDLFSLHPDNTFLIKASYWFNP